MCGFAGYAGEGLREDHRGRVLHAMGRYLAPRGPDDEVVLERPEFGVVFRRLAINDIVGGAQPFVSADGRLVAVVNGEIYNHRELARQYLSDVTLVTRSDCEVVLHLFRKIGAECLARMNGIYSIAIWDQRELMLLLARDRLGVKPLYYTALDDTLVFASELKALLVHPRVPRGIDWVAFGHVPNSVYPFERPAGGVVSTGISGVEFVEPGTWLEWRAGRVLRRTSYWTPRGPDKAFAGVGSAADCVERYADLLADSVRLQLMSDVPIGIFLSGGLDSSLIAGIAAQHTQGLEAFSLVEPSISGTGDTEAAVQLAHHFDIPLHLVRVDQQALRATVRLNLDLLEYFVWIMDFPLFDLEFLFKHELHRYAKAVRGDMKVILLGQGADEFAGGYSALGFSSWKEFTDREAGAFHDALLPQAGIPAAYRGYVNPSVAQSVADERAGSHAPWQYLRFGDLAAYNLWHEDRTAAANGMEVRVPFLDHRLVEFLCAIPERWREELFFDKSIERRAAARFLPTQFASRPKIPMFPSGAGRDDTLVALRRALIDGAFEQYREQYLEPANSIWSPREVASLRERVDRSGGRGPAPYLLLRCMAISIFDRMCQGVRHPAFEPPRLPATAPPLSTESVPPPRDARVTSSSRVMLFESIRLAVAFETPPRLLVLEDGTAVAQIDLPPDCAFGALTHRVLGSRCLEVAQLARIFGVDTAAIETLVADFVARGWGVLLDGAGGGERASLP